MTWQRGTDWCMPRLPAGLSGTCLLVLGIEDVPMSAAEILFWLEREGDGPYTRLQIHGALYGLGLKNRGHVPLAEITEKHGRTAYWQPTVLGREIMAEDLDEETAAANAGKNVAAVAAGSRGAPAGHAALAKLTPERRSEIGRMGKRAQMAASSRNKRNKGES